jgi:L-rhodinosyltransferase/glycosyltransferase
MRVLIAVWPLSAHLYPSVPTAWALQAAGHEVLVASHHTLAAEITAAGLQAVALGAPGQAPDLADLASHMVPEQRRTALEAALGVDQDDANWATFGSWTVASSQIFLPREETSDANCSAWVSAGSLVALATRWQPDLILWDPNMPAAAVAAQVCGALHARLLWGPDVIGWTETLVQQRATQLAAAGLADPVAELIRPLAEHFGVAIDRDLLLGRFTVDPTPVGLRLDVDGVRTLDVRRIPYAGAAEVPSWLLTPPERPRVAVSLGTTQRTFNNDYDIVETLLDVVASLDIEAVGTLDAVQLDGLTVPENMRVVEFVPLTTLLPTCAAIVHHGGIGTLTTAIAHGVPQLVVSRKRAAAYATNAEYVGKSGAGLDYDVVTGAEELTRHLARILTDPAFAEGAAYLQQEWLAMPTPHELVERLESEVAACR